MRSILALAASLVLVLTACGAQDPSTADGSGSVVVGTGKDADLDFAATTLDGSSFDGATLAGKPAVLWFWAPWCPTCRAQSGNVTNLAEQYAGEVAVIAVGGLDSASEIEDLAAEIPHVTHLVDEEGEVWQHFRVTAQSTYTVIDADGEIVVESYLDDGDLNELVAELVDASS